MEFTQWTHLSSLFNDRHQRHCLVQREWYAARCTGAFRSCDRTISKLGSALRYRHYSPHVGDTRRRPLNTPEQLESGRKSSHCRLIRTKRLGSDCYSRSTVFHRGESRRLGELLRPQASREGLAGWGEYSHNYLPIHPYHGIVCWDTTATSPVRATISPVIALPRKALPFTIVRSICGSMYGPAEVAQYPAKQI